MATVRSRGWWQRRTPVERVAVYTLGSLYVLYWFFMVATWLSAVASSRSAAVTVGMGVAAATLAAAGTWALHDSVRLHPARGPLPWRSLSLLLGLVAVAVPLVPMLPDDQRFGGALVVVAALSWGAGGFLDVRVRNGVLLVSTAVAALATQSVAFTVYGLAVSLFLVFTVQSSLWLLGVVRQLDDARDSAAELAVARERLRFSSDVHDVMGRRLSTIAVQAELAAALASRGDPRATDQVLEIRATAHQALREARELARGYRPLDLHAEVEGAVSLLGSAGIDATADVGDVPPARHEPVARVVREAVTNVLRHSRASRVEISYADDELVVANDGVTGAARGSDGSGLATLADHLSGHGARLRAGVEGDRFVVRAGFDRVAAEVAP